MGVFRAQWINQHCPLAWCKEHAVRYVDVAKLAQRYLSVPPTSVASERLFSAAGDIYRDQRTQLAPDLAEVLQFVRENFKHIACLDQIAK